MIITIHCNLNYGNVASPSPSPLPPSLCPITDQTTGEYVAWGPWTRGRFTSMEGLRGPHATRKGAQLKSYASFISGICLLTFSGRAVDRGQPKPQKAKPQVSGDLPYFHAHPAKPWERNTPRHHASRPAGDPEALEETRGLGKPARGLGAGRRASRRAPGRVTRPPAACARAPRSARPTVS